MTMHTLIKTAHIQFTTDVVQSLRILGQSLVE